MAELISIIITTYNREDALEAVLRSLARQTDAAFEVIVADDGSGPETAALVEAWKARVGHWFVCLHAVCTFESETLGEIGWCYGGAFQALRVRSERTASRFG